MRYTSYGLEIQSEFELPTLVASSEMTRADLEIVSSASLDPRPRQTKIRVEKDWAEISISNVGTFRVSEGKRIAVSPHSSDENELFRRRVIGGMLGLALMQRGNLVLHASAVCVHGVAVTILGHSGQGKSTLVAALLEAGHAAVADDVVSVNLGHAPATAVAGPAELRLWPETAAHFGHRVRDLLRVLPNERKRVVKPRQVSQRKPLTLGPLFILAQRSNRAKAEELGSSQGLFELLQRVYRLSWFDASWHERHFQLAATLVQQTQLYRLSAPQGLPRIGEAVKIIEGLTYRPKFDESDAVLTGRAGHVKCL